MSLGFRDWGLGFPKVAATILGAPVMRIIVFLSLYWGTPILGTTILGSGIRGFRIQGLG